MDVAAADVEMWPQLLCSSGARTQGLCFHRKGAEGTSLSSCTHITHAKPAVLWSEHVVAEQPADQRECLTRPMINTVAKMVTKGKCDFSSPCLVSSFSYCPPLPDVSHLAPQLPLPASAFTHTAKPGVLWVIRPVLLQNKHGGKEKCLLSLHSPTPLLGKLIFSSERQLPTVFLLLLGNVSIDLSAREGRTGS